jgi:hypothetical protein
MDDFDFGTFCAFIVTSCLLIMVMAFPFMFLWNLVAVAAVSVAKPISYWTAVGMVVLIAFIGCTGKGRSES